MHNSDSTDSASTELSWMGFSGVGCIAGVISLGVGIICGIMLWNSGWYIAVPLALLIYAVSFGCIGQILTLCGIQIFRTKNIPENDEVGLALPAEAVVTRKQEPAVPIDPISALTGRDAGARFKALHAVLEQQMIDPVTLDALFVAYDNDETVYHYQFYTKAFALAGEAAFPRLRNYLSTPKGESAAQALALIGRPSVPVLAELLRTSSDEQTLRHVSNALYNICRVEGHSAADLAPILAEGIGKPSSRYWCLEAVRRLGPSVKDVILPALAPLTTEDQGQWNGTLISQILGEYGHSDELAFLDCYYKPLEILRRLEPKLGDNSPSVTDAVVRACTQMKKWHIEIGHSMTGKNMVLARENNDALTALVRAAALRLPDPLLKELASLKDIHQGGWRSDSGEIVPAEEVCPDGVRDGALAALRSRGVKVDLWQVALEGTEAIRFAAESGVASDPPCRTSVTVLRAVQTPPPELGITAKLQCHGCWNQFPFEARFATAGVTERRVSCPRCKVVVAVSAFPRDDGRVVLVASPGTEMAGNNQGGPVALWIERLS